MARRQSTGHVRIPQGRIVEELRRSAGAPRRTQPGEASGSERGVTLDVVGGVDAGDDVPAGIPAAEATEMEPLGLRLRADGLEAAAAGAAGHGRDAARADGMGAGLFGGVIDAHGGPPPRTLRAGAGPISDANAPGGLHSGFRGRSNVTRTVP